MSDLTSKFVSQSEIEEKRKKRQEEWDKVRRPDQPKEAPEEEPIDRRSLYDRLQEQKDKKQADYDEQHKLKNQVRGLDNEEADFLEFVSERQQELEAERLREEKEMLALLRVPTEKCVASKPARKESAPDLPARPEVSLGPKKRTQAEILSRIVKRKRSDSNEAAEAKKSKDDSTNEVESSSDSSKDDHEKENPSPTRVVKSADNFVTHEMAGARVIGVLPGIGCYSDSSDSESASSDSEIDTDIFRHRYLPTYLERYKDESTGRSYARQH